MKHSNNLFSPFRTPVILLAAGLIFAGIAACSNVTDYSSEEVPAIPEEALSGEIVPELSNEIIPHLSNEITPEAPVKPHIKGDPVRPHLKVAPVRPHIKVATGNIEIKGKGTLRFAGDDAKPLYIVDGKKYTSFELSDIEPKQIESIEVLRGAAAKAIYGAQAKDGAVIVTKKDEIQE